MFRRVAARFTLLVFFANGLLPAVAQMEPAKPPKLIGEVTLFGEEQPKVEAATKSEIPISRAPGAVTVVTAKQIRESGARTVPDLLRLVAGVNVRWNPMVATVDVRGFGEDPFSNRLLLLIDGIPYNSGDTGGFPLSPAFDFFPVQLIKRIEIVKGPGSSLYGENAFWGVMNIVTLSADDVSGAVVDAYAGTRGHSAFTATYGTNVNNLTNVLGFIRLLRDEMPMQFWRESDSKFRASDLYLKGGHRDFQLSYYRHADRLGGFVEDLSSEGFPPTSEFASTHSVTQTIDILSLKYNRTRPDDPITYNASVSYSHRFGMHCAGCHAAQQEPEFSHPEDHGYQLIGDVHVGVRKFRNHELLFGAEGRRLDRGDHKHELLPSEGTASGYNKYALYAQDQIAALHDRLHLVVGLRHDAKTVLFDAKNSPRISAVYSPTPRSAIRAGYSTAFRFPNFSELYQGSWFLTASSSAGAFPPFPLAVFRQNPTLMPEEITNFDLGGEVALNDNVTAKLDLYRSRVKNFLVIGIETPPAPAPPSIQYLNQPGRATVTGSELEVRTNLRAFTAFANWAHETEHRDSEALNAAATPFEFPYAPRNKFNVGAYAGPFRGVRGSLEYSWRSSFVAPQFWYFVSSGFTDPTVHPLPSYGLVNARLSYDLPVQLAGKERPLRLSVFGQNLTDAHPRETLVGVDTHLTGRRLFAEVELHF